jgi:hypothetical protein
VTPTLREDPLRRWQLSAIFRQKPTFSKRPHFGGSSAFDLSPKAVVHEEPVVVGNAPQSQPFWYEI